MGEAFIRHELDIGIERLKSFGLTVHFSENALKGMDYLEKHPEARAKYLIEAFESDTDMILGAVV